jgi:hypothetical protein
MIVSLVLQFTGLAILFNDLLPSDINSLYAGSFIASGVLLGIFGLLGDDEK